jgi:hypothetical protein
MRATVAASSDASTDFETGNSDESEKAQHRGDHDHSDYSEDDASTD